MLLFYRSQFFQQSFFAVVGASGDRSKFGNKVLRCYTQHQYAVTPINKKQSEIEGISCVSTLTDWYNDLASKNQNLKTGVSIITPPGVTKLILQEGISLGIKNFYLQPGTYDNETDDFLKEQKQSNVDLNIVKSCVLVELGFDDV